LEHHKGFVVMDVDHAGNRTYLTHMKTAEMVTLQGTDWSVYWDPDGLGYGAVADDVSGQVHLMDALFQKKLYKNNSGVHIVVEGVGIYETKTPLATILRRYIDGEISLQTGPSRAEMRLTFYYIKHPQCGFYTYIDLQNLYTIMNFTSYSGCRSKWAYNSAPTWKDALNKLGLNSANVLYGSGGLQVDDALSSTDRFLPTQACSPLGFIVLCARWMSTNFSCGGLRDGKCRAAVGMLLTSFLGIANKAGEHWQIQLSSKTWFDNWPRPSFSINPVHVWVNDMGIVNLTPIKEAIHNGTLPKGSVIRQFWAVVKPHIDEQECTILLLTVFTVCVNRPCQSVFRQFAWHAASRIQSRINPCSIDDIADVTVTFQATDTMWGNNRAIDYNLSRYVDACRAQCRFPKHVSLATDKATVQGMSLSNTIVCLPSNTAMLMVPQVWVH
jgi:hypothetical protein